MYKKRRNKAKVLHKAMFYRRNIQTYLRITFELDIKYSFPESDWAMFSARGPLPGSLQTLNTQVWKEWYPNEGQKYTGNGNAMLEVYSPGDMKSPDYECGIWVPICRPEEQEEYETAEIVSTMMVTGIL